MSGGGSLAAAGALAGVRPAAASAAPLAPPAAAAAPAAVFCRFWPLPRAPRGVRPPWPGRGGMACWQGEGGHDQSSPRVPGMQARGVEGGRKREGISRVLLK